MSFTRFHDDPHRIQKKNLETTSMNEYIFNVPGNNTNQNIFFEDPHLRMQKSGNTLCRNLVQIESELRTLDRRVNCDDVQKNDYLKQQCIKSYMYPTNIKKNITKESRSSHPAWTLKGACTYEQPYLFQDPQQNVEIPFHAYLDTNILEKDYYNIKNSKKI